MNTDLELGSVNMSGLNTAGLKVPDTSANTDADFCLANTFLPVNKIQFDGKITPVSVPVFVVITVEFISNV